MFGSRRPYFLVLIASFVLPAYAGVENRGYLATIGPAPLRFSAPLMAATKLFIPPPPPPPSAPEPPKPAKAETAPASPTTKPSTAAVPQPVNGTNQVNSALPQPAQPDDVVSPQMLLKYFSKSTNGASTSVIAPLGFITPPVSAEPPSSKATYTIGK